MLGKVLGVLSAVALCACCAPLCAFAEETTENPEINQDAQQFYQQFGQELQRIGDANQQALDEGLIVAGSNDYTTTFGVYGSMRLYADYMSKMYGATDPYTYSSIPEGGSCTGLYKIAGDDAYRVVTVSTAGATDTTIVIADDYTVSASCDLINSNYTFNSLTNDNYFGYSIQSTSFFSVTLHSDFQDVQRLGDYNYVTNLYSCWLRFGINANSVPTVNPSTILTYVNTTIGGYPAYSVIPDGQIDPQKPWEYYNDTLVPEIQQNFPDVTVDMLPMGFSYEPAKTDPFEPVQISTKPATIIPEIVISPETEIVDITNESGEIVGTEIEILTENSEGQYNFEMPTIPVFGLPDVDFDFDFSIGSKLSGVVSGIWSAIYELLIGTGLINALVPALTIGILLYILTKLG